MYYCTASEKVKKVTLERYSELMHYSKKVARGTSKIYNIDMESRVKVRIITSDYLILRTPQLDRSKYG